MKQALKWFSLLLLGVVLPARHRCVCNAKEGGMKRAAGPR
jgi:hypothetical protein